MSMRVKAIALYLGSKKLAEMISCSIDFKANGELVVCSEDVVKTQGVTTTDISFEAIVPVGGMSTDVIGQLLNQERLTVLIPMNNKAYSVEVTFDSATVKSMVKSGMTSGDFKASGGPPRGA